jgi:P4 family phage/plasmid primase-like protien
MRTQLEEFLNGCKVEKDHAFTHTGLIPFTGRFSIPVEKEEEFYKIYLSAVEKKEPLSLTEAHREVCPVVIDIDFRFPVEAVARKYSKNDVNELIVLVNEQLRHYFKIENDSDLDAYVFEKPEPVAYNSYVKDGFHLMYPDICSIPDIQLEMRENILKIIKQANSFKHIEFTNTIEDVYDKSVIEKNNWIMYFSHKHQQHPYKLTNIVTSKFEDREDNKTNEELVKFLSIRRPRKLTDIRVGVASLQKKPKLENRITLEYANPEDKETAESLTTLLSSSRCDNYSEWLEVGFCLFNIDNGLLDCWKQFSQQSTKYSCGECERKWSNFRKGSLSIGSLYRWAKLDSPDEFEKLTNILSRQLLLESLSGTNFDVANVVHSFYKHNFVCSSLKHSVWYVFKEHRWVEMQRGLDLRQKLSNEIAKKYKDLSWYFKRLSLDCPQEKIQEYQSRFKSCETLTKLVKTTSFKDKVMTECAELFYDHRFYERLDSNVNILGFSNGVYDLLNLEFRDGRPEDYISYTCGIDYAPYDSQSTKAAEMNTFLSQVLPQNDVREYVLKLMGSFLCGRISDQKFHIWIGGGGNGKSTLIQLFENAFGDYQQKLPITLLTQKRGGSSAASPELAKTKGKRFVGLQEPEENDKIHVGFMKELSGGDVIQARALYSEPIEFKPQFKMVLACNSLPHIPSNDGGTWRRLRVVTFPSKFVDDPDENEIYEFKKDPNLVDKLETWTETFISLLVEKYKLGKAEGHIKEPEEVLKYTLEYQRKSDFWLDYIEESLDHTDQRKDVVNQSNLYGHFREWYAECYNMKTPNRKDFKENMDKRLGKPSTRGWQYYKMKEEFEFANMPEI